MHGKVHMTLPVARLSPSVTFPDIRVVEGRVQERHSQRTAHAEGDSQSLRLLAGVSGEAEREERTLNAVYQTPTSPESEEKLRAEKLT